MNLYLWCSAKRLISASSPAEGPSRGMPSSQPAAVLPDSQHSGSSLQTFCATNFLSSPWVLALTAIQNHLQWREQSTNPHQSQAILGVSDTPLESPARPHYRLPRLQVFSCSSLALAVTVSSLFCFSEIQSILQANSSIEKSFSFNCRGLCIFFTSLHCAKIFLG